MTASTGAVPWTQDSCSSGDSGMLATPSSVSCWNLHRVNNKLVSALTDAHNPTTNVAPFDRLCFMGIVTCDAWWTSQLIRSWLAIVGEATYLTLCQTSAVRRGSCASMAANRMRPALNSRLIWPAGRMTSLPRATSTAGSVRKGLDPCGKLPPESVMMSAAPERPRFSNCQVLGCHSI